MYGNPRLANNTRTLSVFLFFYNIKPPVKELERKCSEIC